MKNLFIFCLLFFFSKVDAQKNEGVITFERRENWTKIFSRLSYLSQEEKDRVSNTWKNEESSEWNKEILNLFFNSNESLYTYKKDEVSSDGYNWRKSDFIVYRDFAQDKRLELIEMLGKTYLVEDSLRVMNWKILNQIKEVAGYICMKAETEDTTKKQKITAWFAQDIPSQAGPEQYFGLPGLILELDINDGDVSVIATNVTFKKLEKELQLPKLKGKKINLAVYNHLLETHIRDSIIAHRYPYWAMRY